MTEEQKKLSEKFRAVRKSQDKLKALEKELEQIFEITQNITTNCESDGTQNGTHRNNTEDNIIEYLTQSDNLCKEIICEKRILLHEIEKVKKAISVVDGDLYSVLSLIYISCYSIEKTAEELGCGETTVKRKRNLALQKIIDNGLVWSTV